MAVIDFQAMKKWNMIPKNIQFLLLDNVFCSDCGVTTIVKYTIRNDKFGIVLEGECKKCGKSVAKYIGDL